MRRRVELGEPGVSSRPVSGPSFWTKQRYRNRGMANLLRMGHCAPAVMQTILDVADTKKEWPVRLSAGLPGGIGNTGFECGGVTSPLVALGLYYGRLRMHQGLPLVFYKGHDHCRRFAEANGTLLCTEIRRGARLPLRCLSPICRSPEYWAQALAGDAGEAIPEEKAVACRRFYSHLSSMDFHCAHAVLRRLGGLIPSRPELLDATTAFMGGTLLKGMTCSAYAAGVMAIGLKIGEIENSRPRVLRMIGTMAVGGDAFGDHMNKFNRIMNMGEKMSEWFAAEFGSTQCRAITRCDFFDAAGVTEYIESGCVTRCRAIAQSVAAMVISLLNESETNRRASSGCDGEYCAGASGGGGCTASPMSRMENGKSSSIEVVGRSEGGVGCR